MEKRWISNPGAASPILRLHNIGLLQQFISDIDVYFKLSRTLIVLYVLLLLQKSCWSWSSSRSLKVKFIITELVNYQGKYVRWIDLQDMSKCVKISVKPGKQTDNLVTFYYIFDTSVSSGKNVLWIYITFIWILYPCR
jgi:hypothetical protein